MRARASPLRCGVLAIYARLSMTSKRLPAWRWFGTRKAWRYTQLAGGMHHGHAHTSIRGSFRMYSRARAIVYGPERLKTPLEKKGITVLTPMNEANETHARFLRHGRMPMLYSFSSPRVSKKADFCTLQFIFVFRFRECTMSKLGMKERKCWPVCVCKCQSPRCFFCGLRNSLGSHGPRNADGQ